VLSTRVPADLADALDAVAERTGLRKKFILESALRERIEDLLDTEDLRQAIQEATGFHRWRDVKREPAARVIRRRA
jgi:predicted transcriptional regulator